MKIIRKRRNTMEINKNHPRSTVISGNQRKAQKATKIKETQRQSMETSEIYENQQTTMEPDRNQLK